MRHSFLGFLFFDIYVGWLVLALICLLVGCIIADYKTPIEDKRYELSYRGEVIHCRVVLPHQADGKVSHWYGVINLTQCDNGKEYFGVTDVEVLKRPKCGYGG